MDGKQSEYDYLNFFKDYTIKNNITREEEIQFSDKIFKVNKKLVPVNNSYNNYNLYKDRKYTRLDCLSYVSRIILNYNRLNGK